MSSIAQILALALRGVIESFSRELVTALWTEFSTILYHPGPLLTDPLVVSVQRVSTMIAMGALPAIVAYKALRSSGEAALGISTTPARLLLRQIFETTITVTGISLYVWFSGEIVSGLVDVITRLPISASIMSLFFDISSTAGSLVWTIFFVIFLGSIMCLVVQRYVFSAEMSILLIIGPFMAMTKMNDGDSTPWRLWKREVFALMLTNLLQLLILWLMTERLAHFTGDPLKDRSFLESLNRWLHAGGMVYLLWNTPRWARQFTYSTGTSHGVAGLNVEAGRLAVLRVMASGLVKGAG